MYTSNTYPFFFSFFDEWKVFIFNFQILFTYVIRSLCVEEPTGWN